MNTFGFEVAWDGGKDVGWCELNLPVKGTRLGLNLLPEETKLISGSGVLTFEVTDLELARKLLEGNNVPSDEIIDIPDLVSYFNGTDSEENNIQFVGEPRIKNKFQEFLIFSWASNAASTIGWYPVHRQRCFSRIL